MRSDCALNHLCMQQSSSSPPPYDDDDGGGDETYPIQVPQTDAVRYHPGITNIF